jgi:protein-disulfide isomerase
MILRGIVQATLLVSAAAILGGAAGSRATRVDWDSVVVETDLGHRIGNPEAKVQLVEFLSYTCPHCAEFAQQGEAPIKLAYLAPGKINVEIRHLIRDPIDLTVGMLVNCGATAKFPGNHNAFILGQSRWIGPLARPTPAQRARWTTAGAAGRRNIASDFAFYPIMERRGYSRTAVDRCLADEAMAQRLAEASAKEWDRPGVDATPTFSINGVVMPGTHTWAALERQLKEFL